MITRSTQVVGISPDLTFEQFQQIAYIAPANAINEACYAAATHYRVSTAFLLAIFLEESTFGTEGLAVANKNPGNRRSSVNKKGLVVDTVKGKFVRYSRWEDGWDDLAYGFVAPNYLYARTGLVTIEQIIYKFAPPEDGNDTEKYIADVVHWMNQWLGSSTTMEIIDLSNNTPSSVYSGRKGFSIQELILHDTSGPNDNNNASVQSCQSALNATIHWFQGGGGLSIHYLIGPEKLGGKIYRLCKEQFAAYHAVGNKGVIEGVSKDNLISIGIERFGQPNEPVGPNQRASMLWLVEDICQRNGLDAGEVVSHMSIQADRRDGNVLLAAARQEVQDGGIKVFDPNPLKKDVGPGVLEVATRDQLTIITNEDFFVAEHKDLGKRSFTYVQKDGVTYQLEAVEQVDGSGNPTGPWKRELWRLDKEYD